MARPTLGLLLLLLGPCYTAPSRAAPSRGAVASLPHGGLLRSLHRRSLPTSSLDEDEIQEAVDIHNELRRIPHASNMQFMTWNQELADAAQLHVDKCVFEHGTLYWPGMTMKTVGQNMLFATGFFLPSIEYGVESFYDEVSYYNYKDNTCRGGEKCGHYTQVVWAESEQVGCGLRRCKNLYFPDGNRNYTNANFFTCNYSPAGNVYSARPYTEGPACTRCSSGRGWCDDGLCRDCSPEKLDTCECKAVCENGGTVTSNCTCACPQGYIGIGCEQECADLHYNCGTGWPKYTCNLPEAQDMVRRLCPKMCGICQPPPAAALTPETPACDVECGDHGQRDDTRCQCTCQPGYYGTNCQHECPESCKDVYPDTCSEWLSVCDHPSYVGFMKEVCYKTCGYCTIPDECK